MHKYQGMKNEEKGDSEIFMLIIHWVLPLLDNGNISLQVTLAYRLLLRTTFLWIGAYALGSLFILRMYLEGICNAVNKFSFRGTPS